MLRIHFVTAYTCIYLLHTRWRKRYRWNLSSEATHGLRLPSLSNLYFLLLEISVKREILIRKIAKRVRTRFWILPPLRR